MTTNSWSPNLDDPSPNCFCENQTLIQLLQNEMFPVMFINQYFWSVLLLPLIKIIQTKINRKKLGLLNGSHLINWGRKVNPHNGHPRHNLQQTCGGSKAVYTIWILSTDNLLTHPTSFRINARLSSKCNKYKSKTNNRSIEKRTWRRF